MERNRVAYTPQDLLKAFLSEHITSNTVIMHAKNFKLAKILYLLKREAYTIQWLYLVGLSLHASIRYHDWVRWSMTQVKCWWKPLSDELSAGPPLWRWYHTGGDLAPHQSQYGRRRLLMLKALGPYHHGGVVSLPLHPAPPQRANHADWFGGGNTHTTYKTHTHWHTNNYMQALSGGRVGRQIAPQTSFFG